MRVSFRPMTAITCAALLAASLLSHPRPAAAQHAAAPGQTGPAALVVFTSGAVSVQRTRGGSVPAGPGVVLAAGDRIVPAAGARAVLLTQDGRKVAATQAMPAEIPQQVARSALFDRAYGVLTRLSGNEAARNPNRQGMYRPIVGSAIPIAPRNQISIRAERPTFAWFALKGSTGYMVQVRRIDGPCAPGFAERPPSCRPMRFRAGKDTTWTVPPAQPALERGATYAWTVASLSGGRPAPEQKFRIVDPREETRVAAALAEITTAGFEPDGDGLFLLALAYRDAGLYYEARTALERLAQRGSGVGPLFHQVQGEVLDRVGDLLGAARAFEAAGGGTSPD